MKRINFKLAPDANIWGGGLRMELPELTTEQVTATFGPCHRDDTGQNTKGYAENYFFTGGLRLCADNRTRREAVTLYSRDGVWRIGGTRDDTAADFAAWLRAEVAK